MEKPSGPSHTRSLVIGNPLSNWTIRTGPEGVTFPVAELDGGAAGPTWLFTAGVHGDEYEGPEAIRRAVAALAGTRFPGRVIAIPVANPMAYAAGVRCTPADGGNLNRSFPGDPRGSLTLRWADFLWTTFMSRADRLIDLHSGGTTWKFEPVGGFYRDEDLPLVAALGLTLWRAPAAKGVLSYEFRERRGRAIGAELGFGGGRDEAMAEKIGYALTMLARGQGTAFDRQAAGPVYVHHDVLTDANGEWTARCGLGQGVQVDQVLGEVHDWSGQLVGRVVSPFAGRVLSVRNLVSVRQGDLVAVIGRPT
ncbi:MAG: succinylglutamate desuccinylase/aspartoacylase family protein [Planctomycetota bacterium]|nr:succinylglutamate desuccinylase/aspartoacylase family protein [Planctomycetota bacterium]